MGINKGWDINVSQPLNLLKDVVIRGCYSQSFSRYFFFNEKPTPNVATIKINVTIIQNTLVAAIAKLNMVKKKIARIDSNKKID